MMDGKKIPIRVGKLGDKVFGLEKNTYYITSECRFVPDVQCFLFDSFHHAIYAIERPFQMYGTPDEDLIKEVYGASSPVKATDMLFESAKQTIDEILAVADPDNCFGTVDVACSGFFPPDSGYFFNSKSLVELYDLLDEAQMKMQVCKEMPDMSKAIGYFRSLIDEYNGKYCDEVHKGIEDPRDLLAPPELLRMGLLMSSEKLPDDISG